MPTPKDSLIAFGLTLLADPEIQNAIRQLLRQALVNAVKNAAANLDKDKEGGANPFTRSLDRAGS